MENETARIKKYYPIKGRIDFFKYFIQSDEGHIYTDANNEEMYFEESELERAKEVRDAILAVKQKREFRQDQPNIYKKFKELFTP